MKKLIKMQLINWHYFNNVTLHFGEINYLTGANTAGKSTIIDAMQVALMGETRGVAFNSAAGKKSERSLKSYLLGTMGDDVNSGVHSVREGKDFSSYIVMEFYDTVKGSYFCIGAVMDVFSDGGDIIKKFFILDDVMPSTAFIENQRTVDSRTFVNRCKAKYTQSKFRYFDTTDAYSKAVLTKTNVHDPRIFSMLKKAISFSPITNIEKFITTNICDVTDINIESMRESIESYQLQEEQAEQHERKLNALTQICDKYDELETLRARRTLQQFFIDYGEWQKTLDQLEEYYRQLDATNADIEAENIKEQTLNDQLVTVNAERDEKRRQYDNFRSENKIELLEDRARSIKAEIKSSETAITAFSSDIDKISKEWTYRVDLLPKEVIDDNSIHLFHQKLKKTLGFSTQAFDYVSADYFAELRAAYNSAKAVIDESRVNSTSEKDILDKEVKSLEHDISVLQSGMLPYPTNAVLLKNAIVEGLRQKYNRDIEVHFLAEMIDISDSEWKNAVEGYLNTQRMNIIVAPEYFMDAYYIYKEINRKRSIKAYSYAVVDLQKVYESKISIKPGSLAEVVTCQDKYIKAYIEYLLGRVHRCYDDSKIRDHSTSVTKDCMLYKSFAVRPINPEIYETPYIGRGSVEVQLKSKQQQFAAVKSKLADIQQTLNSLDQFTNKEWQITEHYISSTVNDCYQKFHLLPDLRERLRNVTNELESIDKTLLETLGQEIEQLNAKINDINNKIKACSEKTGELKAKLNGLEQQYIPNTKLQSENQKESIDSRYSVDYINEVGIPEYDDRLQKLGSVEKLLANFYPSVKQNDTKINAAKDELVDLRSKYNRDYNMAFDVPDTSVNTEYNEAYDTIKNITLPEYHQKIAKAKNDAMEQFKSDFLYRLKDNINTVYERIKELNRALRSAQFGNNSYRFEVKPNEDYLDYYNMIMSSELEQDSMDLFSYDFQMKFKDTIDNLFGQITGEGADTTDAIEAVNRFSKYTTYLSFDLISTDANGITERLSKTINSKSGGEIQTPFYVAILASFVQLYKVNETRGDYDNTMRLVIFDEAFNKMDIDRITELVKLLRELGLQTVICAPADENAGDIVPLCDKALLVDKQQIGKIYSSTVVEWTKEMGELS